MTHDKETALMLTDALSRAYGQGVATVVVNELGLDLGSDESLPSHTIQRALDMARTCGQALSGVDFVTQLHYSAVSHGKGFRVACESLGLSPAAFYSADRQHIDMAMQQRFDQAALQMQSPVSPDTVQNWLREFLRD